MLGNALSLIELDGWLQSDVTSLADLRGQVVMVQFWTFGCSSCKAVLPEVQQIYADYQPQGLEIVGVHSPEFSYEEDPYSIAAAAQDLVRRVQHAGAGFAQQVGGGARGEVGRVDPQGTAGGAPDGRQMALAASGRSVERQARRRISRRGPADE